jgi:spore maturation protein CgeB
MSWLLARPQTRLIVGVERDEAVKRLYRWRLAHHLAESVIWRQAAAAGLHPEYYHTVEAQLAASEAAGPRAALIAPRLNRDRLKVLIFDAGYYLTREINAALHRLGHETRLLPMDSGDACGDGAVSRLLTAVAEFQPDLAVTVNHLGLDQEGVLADVLAGVQLPLASWFVDSPLFILREERRPAKDCAVFVWDADYVQPVKDRGYQRVFFLPLAADERLFKPLNGRPNPLCDWACDVAFVGDSMRRSLSERIERLAPPSDLWPAMENAARLFRDGTDRSPEAAVGRAGLANHPFVQSLSPRGRLRLHELITWWATHLARVELVAALQGLSPTVVGDAGWRALLNGGSYQWRGPVDYYRDLPRFYPLCRVNLNVTSQQMKGGVNQRVFDAPAAGAFLLTDHRDQLDLLFEPGRETAVYGSPDQALDLCRWYLGRDRDRLALARRARRRILAEHTYTHRLSGLLGCMKREFGP